VDGRTPETCAECGFDARDWTVRDAVSLLDALGLWWQLATSDLPATALNRRPGPTVWSALPAGAAGGRTDTERSATGAGRPDRGR
jgi:hypothetical protein